MVLVAWTSNHMMTFSCAESSQQLPFTKWKVTILNEMTTSTLIVHCKSKDDELGEHVLRTRDNYNWSFKEIFWISTLFWCHFSSQHEQVSGDIFWPEGGSWFKDQCIHHNCTWSGRDQGIYLYFGSLKAF